MFGRNKLKQELASICETNSNKGESILGLRINKILGVWDIVCSKGGTLDPFGYLSSLTFKYKSSWVCSKVNKLVNL